MAVQTTAATAVFYRKKRKISMRKLKHMTIFPVLSPHTEGRNIGSEKEGESDQQVEMFQVFFSPFPSPVQSLLFIYFSPNFPSTFHSNTSLVADILYSTIVSTQSLSLLFLKNYPEIRVCFRKNFATKSLSEKAKHKQKTLAASFRTRRRG